ncbi:MAG TPA: hypothetical protein VFW05_11950 [Verrucomicrobiae bacterium]|nr:hypothetical protein [Verrucomicrobiae bacterium]
MNIKEFWLRAIYSEDKSKRVPLEINILQYSIHFSSVPLMAFGYDGGAWKALILLRIWRR